MRKFIVDFDPTFYRSVAGNYEKWRLSISATKPATVLAQNPASSG